jgi:pimeloyl-ACP methyl ester carboxylesterase
MLLSVTAGLLLIYLGLCGVMYLFQRSMIYFPTAARSLDAQTFTLPVGQERILVTSREQEGPEAVLYFGGNAEDVSYGLDEFSHAFPGQSIYLMHYRGYGGSTGSPSETALIGDALALYDHVARRHPKVSIIGRSLGSGIAVRVASTRAVARLVLITPFDSLSAVAAHHYPYFPIRWLLRDRFESWRHAGLVTAPTLIIAAGRDEIVPLQHAKALQTHFKDGVAKLAVIPHAGHNDISEAAEYLSLLSGQLPR